MTIRDILIELGVPSAEIKKRFNNYQIKLNGESVSNFELNVNENFIMDSGDFITSFFDRKGLTTLNTWMKICSLSLPEMFGERSNVSFIDCLESFSCLSISKNEHYILMNN